MGIIIWFTGLSGSGKSTLSYKIFNYLLSKKYNVIVIDGDKIRGKDEQKNNDFSFDGIINNNEKIINYCKMLQKSYDFIIVSVISPFSLTRKKAREIFGDKYKEIFVKASLNTVIQRDTKGLYSKYISGKMKNMIGLDPNVPYEEPRTPDIILNTDIESDDESVNKLIEFLNIDKS